MAKKTSKTGETKTKLLAAMVHRQQSTRLQVIARDAGVSTNTLNQIIKGKYGPADELRPDETPTPKKLQGWAEVLTRLCLYLKTGPDGSVLDPEDVINEYKIPSNPVVKEAIERTKLRWSAPHRESDPALDAIESRKTVDQPAEVRAGILRWEPFVAAGQKIESSWGWRFTQRLIACINPEWKCTPVEIDTIDKALSSVFERSPGCEIVFGMYDTPYRRLRDLNFIHLPGLGVPLGALHDPNIGVAITWNDLLIPPPSSLDRSRIVVLGGEVGHLFFWGPCRYEASDFVIVESGAGDTPGIAAQFASEIHSRKEGRNVIFTADCLTCTRVLDELTTKSNWVARLPQSLSGAAREELVKRMRSVTKVQYEPDLIPVYRLGLSFRADARRWGELLLIARDDEMFRNAVGITAEAYAQILAASSDIKILPLHPDLSPISARNFAEMVKTRLEDRDHDAVHKELIMQEIDKYWKELSEKELKESKKLRENDRTTKNKGE